MKAAGKTPQIYAMRISAKRRKVAGKINLCRRCWINTARESEHKRIGIEKRYPTTGDRHCDLFLRNDVSKFVSWLWPWCFACNTRFLSPCIGWILIFSCPSRCEDHVWTVFDDTKWRVSLPMNIAPHCSNSRGNYLLATSLFLLFKRSRIHWESIIYAELSQGGMLSHQHLRKGLPLDKGAIDYLRNAADLYVLRVVY